MEGFWGRAGGQVTVLLYPQTRAALQLVALWSMCGLLSYTASCLTFKATKCGVKALQHNTKKSRPTCTGRNTPPVHPATIPVGIQKQLNETTKRGILYALTNRPSQPASKERRHTTHRLTSPPPTWRAHCPTPWACPPSNASAATYVAKPTPQPQRHPGYNNNQTTPQKSPCSGAEQNPTGCSSCGAAATPPLPLPLLPLPCCFTCFLSAQPMCPAPPPPAAPNPFLLLHPTPTTCCRHCRCCCCHTSRQCTRPAAAAA